MKNITGMAAAAAIAAAAGFIIFAAVQSVKEKNDTNVPAFEKENDRSSVQSESSRVKENDGSSAQSESSHVKDTADRQLDLDTEKMAQAYRSGDLSGLTDDEKLVLDRAAELLDEIITDDMDDFEKELAVHDMLVERCTYDKKALGVFGGHSLNADNAYGALFNGEAICGGYSQSFKLLTEMLGFQCDIISGTNDEGEEHAWDLISINGERYYVDVTWDDPVPDNGGLVSHEFYNVTEDKMRDTGHIWKSSEDLAVRDIKHSFPSCTLREVGSYSELAEAVSAAIAANDDSVHVVFSDDLGITIGDDIYEETYPELYEDYLRPLEWEFSQYYLVYMAELADSGNCLSIYLV